MNNSLICLRYCRLPVRCRACIVRGSNPIESNQSDSIRVGRDSVMGSFSWIMLGLSCCMLSVVDAGALAAIMLASLSMIQFSHRLS